MSDRTAREQPNGTVGRSFPAPGQQVLRRIERGDYGHDQPVVLDVVTCTSQHSGETHPGISEYIPQEETRSGSAFGPDPGAQWSYYRRHRS